MDNLENVMLSDRCQSQKATQSMTPFIGKVWNRQMYRQRAVSGCLGTGNGKKREKVWGYFPK